jgi:hypothetical protein
MCGYYPDNYVLIGGQKRLWQADSEHLATYLSIKTTNRGNTPDLKATIKFALNANSFAVEIQKKKEDILLTEMSHIKKYLLNCRQMHFIRACHCFAYTSRSTRFELDFATASVSEIDVYYHHYTFEIRHPEMIQYLWLQDHHDELCSYVGSYQTELDGQDILFGSNKEAKMPYIGFTNYEDTLERLQMILAFD